MQTYDDYYAIETYVIVLSYMKKIKTLRGNIVLNLSNLEVKIQHKRLFFIPSILEGTQECTGFILMLSDMISRCL
jgi:hypothetical protein